MGLSALRKDAAVLYYTRAAPSRRKTAKPDRDFGPHAPPLVLCAQHQRKAERKQTALAAPALRLPGPACGSCTA